MNMVLAIDNFKQQLAYSINNSKLPAEIIKYILQDFCVALDKLAIQQLNEARETQNKEDTIEENES